MSQLLEIIQQDKDAILAIAKQYRAENVRIFGSVARGDDHNGSDIDLLVDFQPGSSLFDQVALMECLTEKLGRKVDVVSARALNKYLRESVLEDAIAL